MKRMTSIASIVAVALAVVGLAGCAGPCTMSYRLACSSSTTSPPPDTLPDSAERVGQVAIESNPTDPGQVAVEPPICAAIPTIPIRAVPNRERRKAW